MGLAASLMFGFSALSFSQLSPFSLFKSELSQPNLFHCPPQLQVPPVVIKLPEIDRDVPEIQAVSLLSVMAMETFFPDNAIRTVIVDV